MIYVAENFGDSINLELSFLGKRKKKQLLIFKPWLQILSLYHMIWWGSKWEPMHICKHEAICSVMMAELKKSPKKHIATQNRKIKTDQQ